MTARASFERPEYRCGGCGYGAVRKRPPDRCPMCGGSSWRPPRRTLRLRTV